MKTIINQDQIDLLVSRKSQDLEKIQLSNLNIQKTDEKQSDFQNNQNLQIDDQQFKKDLDQNDQDLIEKQRKEEQLRLDKIEQDYQSTLINKLSEMTDEDFIDQFVKKVFQQFDKKKRKGKLNKSEFKNALKHIAYMAQLEILYQQEESNLDVWFNRINRNNKGVLEPQDLKSFLYEIFQKEGYQDTRNQLNYYMIDRRKITTLDMLKGSIGMLSILFLCKIF